MSEALARVKQDLGRDAVILNTRHIRRGGVLGVGARAMVEVTATADDRVTALRRQLAVAGEDAPERSAGAPAIDRVAGKTKPVAPGAAAAPIDEAAPAISAKVGLPSELREELEAIRRMVGDVMRNQRAARAPRAPAELIDQYTALIGQEVAEEIAEQIVEQLRQRLAIGSVMIGASTGAGEAADARVRAELRACIAEFVPASSPLDAPATGRAVVLAFVGPTGVGKTTTIAKLAANLSLRAGRRVGLITLDAYRIAAADQLRTYAQIMDVPMHAVTTAEGLCATLEELRSLDVVLIDTAGCSQKDGERIEDLARLLGAARPDEVHLVLSSTSRESTILEAAERFAACGVNHLVFTKIDEAIGFGVLLNVLRAVNLRLSYLTHGQSVPGDIERGSAQRIAELIVGTDR